ncbi:C2H2-type zinc finger protein [Endozoicomonas sp. 4G]|uniref:C2H2-type zinc finger protein n=1 Tax=Endozoicomonas sp. 4G TaxID=2872754 RepID=UPI0020789EC7|nr:C2H2-type zinc finger protein [Endozoicomonas sp. 4G]
MLSKKTLILTLVIALSVHCSNGRAQENRLPLLVALAVGKALINAPKPFIKVLSTKGAYVMGIETILLPLFPVRDGLPDEQESEAIEWWELKVHSRAASDDSAYSEDSDSKGSSTSDESNDKRSNEDEDEASAESDVQYETTTLNPFRVANETSQYCTTLEFKNIKQEPVSVSEIATNGTSDESSNRSNEDESDVRYETTTLNPFRVSNEISQYGATLELKKIKEEPVSDSEILTYSTDDQRIKKPKIHQCEHEGCDYSTNRAENLKTHKQTHLPADQRPKRPKIHQCDHEGCNFSTYRMSNLKMHKKTHLPADQRVKAYQCDHEGCDYNTDWASVLKKHKETHLPAHQRLKEHQCDHQGCNYSTDNSGSLKKHKKTHLPANQRPRRLKVHQCDHGSCNYSSQHLGHLKRHKQIHLPADQRVKVYQCDHEGCDFSTIHASNLKRHKQTHLPANQRAKRKAYDQLPSNEKRKKCD